MFGQVFQGARVEQLVVVCHKQLLGLCDSRLGLEFAGPVQLKQHLLDI